MSGGRARRSLLSSIWGHLRSFEFECTTRQPPLHHRRFSGLTDAKHAPSRPFSSLVGRRDGGGVQIWEAGMYSRLRQGFVTSNKSFTQVCVCGHVQRLLAEFLLYISVEEDGSEKWSQVNCGRRLQRHLRNSVMKMLRNHFRSWLSVCLSCSSAIVTLEW